MNELPPIAPDEALVATLGLTQIIDRTPEKVRKSTLLDVANLSKRLADEAKALARDELKGVRRPRVDYRAMLRKLLGDNFTLAEDIAVTESFPDDMQDQAGLYLAKAKSMIDQLKAAFPVATYNTFAGPTTLLPSSVSVWRWAGLLQISDDPCCVFSLIAAGALTKNMAEALRLTYPTLQPAIEAAIRSAVADERVKSKAYQLTARAEVGMAAFLGETRFDPKLTATLQKNVQKSAEQKQAPAKPAGPANAKAGADLTATQRAQYGSLGGK